MAKINSKVTATIESLYNTTSKSTGAASFILRVMRDFKGDIYEEITREAENINSQQRLKGLADVCQSISKHLQEDGQKAAATDFTRLVEWFKVTADAASPSVEDLRFPTPEEADEMISTLTGKARALALLFWNGGFKPEDLARDKYQLSKVGEGLVEVTGGMGTTKPRIVQSDYAFGLTTEDCEELIPLLQGALFTNETLGLQVLQRIGSATNGWKFSPTQLRVGHAEALLEDGMSQADVAEIQGIKQNTLRIRQRKYRNARKG